MGRKKSKAKQLQSAPDGAESMQEDVAVPQALKDMLQGDRLVPIPVARAGGTSRQYTHIEKLGRPYIGPNAESYFIKLKGKGDIPLPIGYTGTTAAWGARFRFWTASDADDEPVIHLSLLGSPEDSLPYLTFAVTGELSLNHFVNKALPRKLGVDLDKVSTRYSAPGFFGWGDADVLQCLLEQFKPGIEEFNMAVMAAHIKDAIHVGRLDWAIMGQSDESLMLYQMTRPHADSSDARLTKKLVLYADLTYKLYLRGRHVVLTDNSDGMEINGDMLKRRHSDWAIVRGAFSQMPTLRSRNDVDSLFDLLSMFTACTGVREPSAYQKLIDARGENFGLSKDLKVRSILVVKEPDLQLFSMNCRGLCAEEPCCDACMMVGYTLRTQLRRYEATGGAAGMADPGRHVDVNRVSHSVLADRLRNARARDKGKLRAVTEKLERLESVAKRMQWKRLPQHQSVALEDILRQCVDSGLRPTIDGEEAPSFAALLHEQLDRLNGKNTRKEWHPLVLKWCLSVYIKSPSAYEAMRDTGFLQLPHKTTLQKLINGVKQHGGIVPEHMEQIKTAFASLKWNRAYDKEMIVMLDEVAIQDGLAWRIHKGKAGTEYELVGFADEFDKVVGDNTSAPATATKVLQYMIRSATRNWAMPVAYYEYRDGSATRVNHTFWEVVRALHTIGLEVHAAVLDGAAENRTFIKMNVALESDSSPLSDKFVRAHCTNPFTGRNLWFINESPHMIKKLRNAMMSSKRHVTVEVDGTEYVAKMQHVSEAYHWDIAQEGMRVMHKITQAHLTPNPWEKMRVRLAAQLLSNTVSSHLHTYLVEQKKPYVLGTVVYAKQCNDMFDMLNEHKGVSDSNSHIYKNNIYRLLDWFKAQQCRVANKMGYTPVQREKMWLAGKTMFDLELAVQGIVGYMTDMHAIHRDMLIQPSRFNQDPLENFFGQIRSKGGAHRNPTAGQYGDRVQGIIMASTTRLVTKKGNSGTSKTAANIRMPLLKRK